MKKLLSIFKQQADSQTSKKAKKEAMKPVNNRSAKLKDFTNAEITPGIFFEHYKEVLIRPKDILKKLKEG